MQRYSINHVWQHARFAGAVWIGIMTWGAIQPSLLPQAHAKVILIQDTKDPDPFVDNGEEEVFEVQPMPNVPPQGTIFDNGSAPFPSPQSSPQLPFDRSPTSPPAPLQANGAKQREDNMRRLMRSLGCDVPEIQDAIISYIEQDTTARQPLRDSTSRLFMAMRTPTLPDGQLSVYLKECRSALEADKNRRNAAESTLRNAIGYQMTPRLEAMLLLLGTESGIAFSAPNPKLVTQLEQEKKRLRRDMDGFKIEVESLRRERDAARSERESLKRDNEALKKELDKLRR